MNDGQFRVPEVEDQKIWVPFVDLMAGTVAVLIIFFLGIAIIGLRERRNREESVEVALSKIEQRIVAANLSDMITVDPKKRRISLTDAVFESGSSCLSEKAMDALRQVGIEQLLPLLQKEQSFQILVEGHTDTRPLGRVVASPCGAFNDNYSLSAARANTARSVLLSDWPDEYERRVSIAGYGPSRLLIPSDPFDGRNRRVEIRIETEKAITQ